MKCKTPKCIKNVQSRKGLVFSPFGMEDVHHMNANKKHKNEKLIGNFE